MEENNNYVNEEKKEHYKEHHCFMCKHPFLKYLLTALMVFLGAFTAFYVVADWHFKRMMDPAVQMRNFERAMIKQERKMDKFAQKEFQKARKFEQNTAQFIRVEQNEGFYKIIIDLRPFDNNEKNIEIKTEGNTLTINAAGEKNMKNKKEVIKYTQTFAFGENVDVNDITKVREGNNYIISVPFD